MRAFYTRKIYTLAYHQILLKYIPKMINLLAFIIKLPLKIIVLYYIMYYMSYYIKYVSK